MISNKEYQEYLRKIGPKFNNQNINWDEWYKQYVYYENMWEEYFESIFLKSIGGDSVIDLVLWESCPGGMPFPHQNYVFDSNRYNNSIHGTFDSYLKKVCIKYGIKWKNDKRDNEKIEDLIKNLCKNNVLVLDTYPTHGVSLDSTNRANLYKYVFGRYSINKFRHIKCELEKKQMNINCKIYCSDELFNNGLKDIDPEMRERIKTALGLNCDPNISQL